MEQKALAGWIHVATFPERRRAWWGCYWETWSTPLTQHIATDETKRRTKKKNPPNSSPHLSVRLGCNSGAFCRLLHGGFLFSSVLGDLRSHALFCFFLRGCNKGAQPIKWLNKDRKASCPKNSSLPLTGVEEEEIEELRRAIKTRRTRKKMWLRRGQTFLPIFNFYFFFPPSRSRVWKWRNWPRRKWDAEYNAQVRWWMGAGAMTTQPGRLHQSQVQDSNKHGWWCWGRNGRCRGV